MCVYPYFQTHAVLEDQNGYLLIIKVTILSRVSDLVIRKLHRKLDLFQ